LRALDRQFQAGQIDILLDFKGLDVDPANHALVVNQYIWVAHEVKLKFARTYDTIKE